MCVCASLCLGPPEFSRYTSLHSLHRSASARSALKHMISIDFSIFNLQEQTSKLYENQPKIIACGTASWKISPKRTKYKSL